MLFLLRIFLVTLPVIHSLTRSVWLAGWLAGWLDLNESTHQLNDLTIYISTNSLHQNNQNILRTKYVFRILLFNPEITSVSFINCNIYLHFILYLYSYSGCVLLKIIPINVPISESFLSRSQSVSH